MIRAHMLFANEAFLNGCSIYLSRKPTFPSKFSFCSMFPDLLGFANACTALHCCTAPSSRFCSILLLYVCFGVSIVGFDIIVGFENWFTSVIVRWDFDRNLSEISPGKFEISAGGWWISSKIPEASLKYLRHLPNLVGEKESRAQHWCRFSPAETP